MPYLRVKNELPLIPGYAEGAIAYAPDAAEAPLNECICYINPVQSGSGDPSPSNVRPITGHTELNLVQKDGNDTVVHTYTTDLGTTVYGGTLDVETGVLTIDRAFETVSNLNWGYTSGKFYSTNTLGMLKNTGKTIISDTYKTVDNISGSASTMDDMSVCCINNPSGLDRIYITDSNYTDETTFKSARASTQLCFRLATPITTQLTPQEVKSLLGSNNFYHDCNGDTKITYIRRLDS